MNRRNKTRVAIAALALAVVTFTGGTTLRGQVGKGILDANSSSEKDLLALPHMTPAIVKGLMDKRPFASVVDLNTFLTGQGLTAQNATDFYGKAFVHVNLNTATR